MPITETGELVIGGITETGAAVVGGLLTEAGAVVFPAAGGAGVSSALGTPDEALRRLLVGPAGPAEAALRLAGARAEIHEAAQRRHQDYLPNRIAVLLTRSQGPLGNGVYYSDDDGVAWTRWPGSVSPNNDDARIYSAGFAAFEDVWLAVGTDSHDSPTALVVWASADSGKTWAARQTITGYNLATDELCHFDDDFQFVVAHRASDGVCRLLRSTDRFQTYATVNPAASTDLGNPVDVKGIARLVNQIDFEMVGMATIPGSVLGAAAIDSADGGLTFVYLNPPTSGSMDGRRILGPANLVNTAGRLWLAGLPPSPTAGEDIYDAPVGPYVPSGYRLAGQGTISVGGSRVPYRSDQWSTLRQLFLLIGISGVGYTSDGAAWADLGSASGDVPSSGLAFVWALPSGTFLWNTGGGGGGGMGRSTDQGRTWQSTAVGGGFYQISGVSLMTGAAGALYTRATVGEALARPSRPAAAPEEAKGLLTALRASFEEALHTASLVMAAASPIEARLGARASSAPVLEALRRLAGGLGTPREARGGLRGGAGASLEALRALAASAAGAEEARRRALLAAAGVQEAAGRALAAARSAFEAARTPPPSATSAKAKFTLDLRGGGKFGGVRGAMRIPKREGH